MGRGRYRVCCGGIINDEQASLGQWPVAVANVLVGLGEGGGAVRELIGAGTVGVFGGGAAQ